MRLGAQPCQLALGTKAAELYGSFVINERHRHRYEFNNAYRDKFEKAGFVFSGLSPDGKLVEDHRTDQTIPFSSPASSIPNFRASRTSRIRCSRVSSPPRTRTSTRSRCNSRQANDVCRKPFNFFTALRLFGAKFGLENTFQLAALAGNPQDRLRFIHVAGTNGKGSTCAMLESIYRAAGLRVGLFTSPHLVSFRERIQVNRQLIPENDVVRLVEELRPWLKQFPDGHHPTFFEVVTVMALKFFAEQNCDLVIWETGLGGRLDATNIVTPLASVITNIQFDHQQWLGDTLAKLPPKRPASSSRACRSSPPRMNRELWP